MTDLLQDVRYAWRMLRRTPGFTAVAVITLALGIGANTAIFSIIDAVLLRPLPFAKPGELVRLYETEAAPGNFPFTGPDFLDWKTQNHTFQDMALYGWGRNVNLSGQGQPEHIRGMPAEANFFNLLGARPLLGRTFAPEEDQRGHERVVVLSYGLWQNHFAADRSIVGRSIELDGQGFTVIGVMPPSFRYPASAQLWMPLVMDSKSLGQRGSHSFAAIGRLKPGVTLQQAQAEMSVIAANLERQYPESNAKVGASLVALHEDMVGHSRKSLLMMLWAVALVLLIACANVANLLLSRAVGRQKEMAVRSALGAARGRLVRQLLTESVLLAVAGGGVGLAVASAGVETITKLKNLGIPATNPIQLNSEVLAFTFGLAVLTGILFGIVPALQTARPDLFDELKGGAGSSISHSRRRRLASDALVVAEVGLSLFLLICAGLLLKDFARLRHSNIGVNPQGVLTAAISLPREKYSEDQQQFDFSQAVLEKVSHLPGVETAALTSMLPLEGGRNGYITVRGQPFQPMTGPLVENHGISPGYFRVMGIPLLKGRELTAEDIATEFALDLRVRELYKKAGDNKPPADITNAIVYPTIINQAMARTFWPNQDSIGRMYSRNGENGPWRQVVGVVADVKQWGLTQGAIPESYTGYTGEWFVVVTVRTSLPPASMTSALRQAVAQLDSTLPLFQVRTMDEVIAESAGDLRFLTTLVGLFAGLALLLAAVGIYGVLSYLVTQRTREIGIRMSLGASRGRVLALMLNHGLRLAAVGVVIGVVGAIAGGRVLASTLYEVKPGDPLTIVVTALGLVLVAFVACYVPARRATKVDPVQALRYE